MTIDSTIIRRIPPLDSGHIRRHLEALVSMGPRWPSSPAERFAAAYLEEQMRPLVDEITSEPFGYPLYIPLEAGLEVLSEGGRECAALGVQYSANGECEGELFYIEEADSFDPGSSPAPLDGKVLLARTRRPYVLAAGSEGTGALGIVVVSESPENTIRAMGTSMGTRVGYVQGTDPESHRVSLPMVAVDAASGRHLQELCAGGGARVHLTHRSLQVSRRSRNIVGRISGKTGKSIVTGAHYDTQINVPGAWDNAAGCAVLLEMARAARGLERVHDMEFAVFGCEEVGIVGSSFHVERRRSGLEKIACYFNLDSVSSSTSTTLDVQTPPGLERFTAEVVEKVCTLRPTSYNQFGPLNIAQDSAPFFSHGVAAVWLHEEGNPFFHTPQDTPEKVDIGRLARVGGAIWTMAAYLALGGSMGGRGTEL